MESKTTAARIGARAIAVAAAVALPMMLSTAPAGVQAAAGGFKPVSLPDPGVAGYQFPEPEATVVGWAARNDVKAMATHAWGLWTALNAPSGEWFEGQPLRVFETWETPGDIVPSDGAAAARPRDPRPLGDFHQLQRKRAAGGGGSAALAGDDTVKGFVKYDPSAAQHIRAHQLFSKSALNALFAQKAKEIPVFPSTAISLKAVWKIARAAELVQGRYFRVWAWPGPPAQPVAFPETQWGTCVWVDVKDGSPGPGSAVDSVCHKSGLSRSSRSTFGLGRFVAFQLSARQAAAANAAPRGTALAGLAPAAAGDWALLVAMHVTSRETTRWTWQSFWWVPDPASPSAPSSKQIASLRPPQLKGAPANYAHCGAYSMEYPPQPNTGGKNAGNSVYCYNPYLEAPFGPGDLPDSIAGTYQGKAVANDVGVQTNCMSCHARANFNVSASHAPDYSGDRYVDLDDPQFQGTLQVDFLWSIPQKANGQ